LWQIIFVVFVPILDLWAFYRIKKLRKYLLYVYLPQIIIGGVIAGFILSMVFEESSLDRLESFSEDLQGNDLILVVSNIVLGLGFTIFSIYLIATWSEKWNKQLSNE
jgi:di/tricarboxylate transporter